MNLSTKKYNSAIRKWGRQTKTAFLTEAVRLGVKMSNSGGFNKMTNGFGTRNGEIIRVSFGMKRHLIYVHKGVGRGWPIARQGGTAATLAGGRKPKPFINNVMDRRINELADSVQNFKADIVVENIKVR
jgi:hypothetical protein